MSATAKLDRAAMALTARAFLGDDVSQTLAGIPFGKLSANIRELVEAVRNDLQEYGSVDQKRVFGKANGNGDVWSGLLSDAASFSDHVDEARKMLAEAMKAAPAIVTLETLNPRTAADLIAADIPDPVPLIDGLIYPETITVIGALVKMRKTWLALQAALSGVSGASFLGHTVRRKLRVLYIGGEGSDRTLRKRLLLAIGYIPNLKDEDLQNFGIVSTLGRVKLDTPAGEEWLQRVSDGYDLVMVDPYYRFLSVGSENLHEDQRTIQDVFDRLKAKGKGVVLVHHLRKPQGTDAGAAELRGAGLDAFADSILLLSKKRSAGAIDRFRLRYILRHDEEPDDLELSPLGPLFKLAEPEPPKVLADDLVEVLAEATEPLGTTKLKAAVKNQIPEATRKEIEEAITLAVKEGKIRSRPMPGRGQGREYFLV